MVFLSLIVVAGSLLGARVGAEGLTLESATTGGERLTEGIRFFPGPVNGVLISDATGEHRWSVYGLPATLGGPPVDQVLFTHHRRDVVSSGRRLAERGASVVAPEAERPFFEEPQVFWAEFWSERFHDYEQQSTKILTRPVPVDRGVSAGDELALGDQTIQVIETPGFTRGAVSYAMTTEGQTLVFTGDLIYGDGQVWDLYSFQDAIPEANIRGYHGYAARLADLISSLERLRALEPDVLVPARGPVIRDPEASMIRLIERVRALYRNYLSTNALYWYFKDERIQQCAARILGPDGDYEVMPYSHYEEAPDWVLSTSTSRVLVSDEGYGFLIDCGYTHVIDFVQRLIDSGVIQGIEGIFVTHYHDDHSNQVQAAAEAFRCPVYAVGELKDILERPSAYRMPAMTANPIRPVIGLSDGANLWWREFELTVHFFPGQTLYHGGLTARRPNGQTVRFVGDAFTPSGMDDYCLLNRNLLHEDNGYLLCLKRLAEWGSEAFLMNEHVTQVFRYSDSQRERLRSDYRERVDMVASLTPWDDPNFAVDEQWARFDPYGTEATVGDRIPMKFVIWNHSPVDRVFRLALNLPAGWRVVEAPPVLQARAREEVAVALEVEAPAVSQPGVHVITMDIESAGVSLSEWAEALILVRPRSPQDR